MQYTHIYVRWDSRVLALVFRKERHGCPKINTYSFLLKTAVGIFCHFHEASLETSECDCSVSEWLSDCDGWLLNEGTVYRRTGVQHIFQPTQRRYLDLVVVEIHNLSQKSTSSSQKTPLLGYWVEGYNMYQKASEKRRPRIISICTCIMMNATFWPFGRGLQKMKSFSYTSFYFSRKFYGNQIDICCQKIISSTKHSYMHAF